MNHNFLNIPEEIYLLSIDENGNQHQNLKSETFDLVISASILMDLALLHRIDSDQTFIFTDKTEPIGDILLDGVLDEIKEYNDNRRIENWISYLSIHGQYFRDEIITSLVRKSVLRIENEKVLWFFSKRKYPRVDDTELEEVQSRIRHLIEGDSLPDERDIVIVSVLYNSGILGAIFTKEEIEKYSKRIEQIAKMDFIGQAIGDVLKEYNLSIFDKITKTESAEEMLEEHVKTLKKKYRVTNDANLPAWIRKGTEQYEKTLEYVREVGTAEITFNPRNKKYSKLNYTYYQSAFGE